MWQRYFSYFNLWLTFSNFSHISLTKFTHVFILPNNQSLSFSKVRDLGNPKSKKGKEVPAYYEVCEPCKLYLDNGEDIPLTLLARLIKFKLLAIKTTDLKRREAEKKVWAKQLISLCCSVRHSGCSHSVYTLHIYIACSVSYDLCWLIYFTHLRF